MLILKQKARLIPWKSTQKGCDSAPKEIWIIVQNRESEEVAK